MPNRISTAAAVARVALVAAGVVASAPAVWWLVDRLAGIGAQVDPATADYAWQPLPLGPLAGDVIGVGALLLVAAAVSVLWRQVRAGRWPSVSWQVAIAAAIPFGYAGTFVAVATEPVIGANIGFGLMALGAVPVVLGSLAWLAVAGRRLHTHRRHAG